MPCKERWSEHRSYDFPHKPVRNLNLTPLKAGIIFLGSVFNLSGRFSDLIIFLLFHLTYSRWTSSLLSCLWSQRIFPSLPGSRLTIFYRDASSALLQLVNQWSNFTYSRTYNNAFRYGRKNTHPGDKNRTHDFRTRSCTGYLLDHCDEGLRDLKISNFWSNFPGWKQNFVERREFIFVFFYYWDGGMLCYLYYRTGGGRNVVLLIEEGNFVEPARI